jgi:hypothetical protein
VSCAFFQRRFSAQAALLAQLSQLKTGGLKEDSKLSYDLIRQIQHVDDIDKLKTPLKIIK